MRTLTYPSFDKITENYTPEEIEKYSTFHWLVDGDVDYDDRDGTNARTHAWQTIGGRCRYLGTMKDVMETREPAEQLPLIPTLDFESVSAGGPLPSGGGCIPFVADHQPEAE